MYHAMNVENTVDVQMNWTPDKGELYATRKGECLDGIAIRWHRMPSGDTRPKDVYIYVDGRKEPLYLGYTREHWGEVRGVVRFGEDKSIMIGVWDEVAIKAGELIRSNPRGRHLLISPSYYVFERLM